ncbi:hypothetical protein AOZ06_07780 [Kibdelosporangium phytohabitans]|uniref:Phage head morphogenesis domain-containing protein n=2 Tax=Kibdelosporangium phytohabitans TaxID=860235 RepID=A0A0N9HXB9_9PSEU|nr:hypothetical protein AOZ06_07780 [Kibdelosporangium phytohabitans]
MWREVGEFDEWRSRLAELLVVLTGAQQSAAQQADRYLDRVLGTQNIDPDAVGLVRPQAVAGVASDGRELATLLAQPITAAKLAVAAGASQVEGLAVGLATLQMLVRTQVADAGRAADTVAMVARPNAGGYTRMTVGKSCARCVILAGRWYRWSAGFKRHPQCNCTMVPSREALASDLRMDPRRQIEAGLVTGLSQREREAIALGADPSQVVNAQRGVKTAGGVESTTTGTTRRGVAGARILARDLVRAGGQDVTEQTFTNLTLDRLTTAGRLAELQQRGETFTRLTKTGREQQYAYRFARSPRLTPDQILASASSRDEAIRLLTNNGYII